MSTLTTYPLRLPRSIKAAAERLSKADGTSLNQFVATAVAEKIAVMEASAFFEVRAQRARAAAERGEPSALLAALNRAGGEPPRRRRAAARPSARGRVDSRGAKPPRVRAPARKPAKKRA